MPASIPEPDRMAPLYDPALKALEPVKSPRRFTGPPSPWAWTLALALASAALVLAKPYVTSRPHGEPFSVTSTDKNGRVQLQWNPQSEVVKTAQSGVLDVVDGTATHRYPIDARVLASGGLDYVRTSDDAVVTLTLTKDTQVVGQAVVESVGSIVHPLPAARSTPRYLTGTRARRRR